MSPFGPPNIEKLVAKRDVRGLIKASTDQDAEVRRQAALALGALGDPAAFAPLLHLTGRLSTRELRDTNRKGPLPEEPDPRVHAAAIEALGVLVGAVGLEEFAAFNAIIDDAGGGAKAAAYDFGQRWNDDLLCDKAVSEAARKALVGLSDRYPVAVGRGLILRFYEYGSGRTNLTMWQRGDLIDDLITSLGEVGARVLFAAGGTWEAHCSSIVSHIMLLGDRALAPAVQALRSREPQARELAAIVLGKLGDRQAAAPLVEALEGTDAIVRREAARALNNLGWEPTSDVEKAHYLIAEITNVLRQKELQRMGAPAVEPLIDCLRYTRLKPPRDDEDAGERLRYERRANAGMAWKVRPSAAETLGKMADKRAVDALIEALRERDSRLQRSAAEALGKLGDPRAIEPLIEAAEHSIDVRDVANEAVRKLRRLPKPRH
jgi:HEAT repeat protein